MAFVSRTTRDNNKVGLRAPATTPAVGPGTYNLDTGFGKVTPGYAPFTTSSKRGDVTAGAPRGIPGPGAYAPGEKPPPRWPKAETPFGTLSERWGDDPRSEMPGPGAYALPSSFSRSRKSRRGGRATTAPDHGGLPANGITWVRVPTAPSIPARHQSFGYEEGPHGELLPEKPSVMVVDDSKLGPGAYDPRVDLASSVGRRGTSFGRSRSKRFTNDKSVLPASDPGLYQPEYRPVTTQPGRLTSAFASRTTRAGEPLPSPLSVSRPQTTRLPGRHEERPNKAVKIMKQRKAPLPGPGSYDAHSAFRVEGKPERLQFFGSTERRFRSEQQTFAPGPGQYGAQATFSQQRVLGPAVAAKPRAKAPFSTTSQRFKKNVADTPGVGAYDALPPTKHSASLKPAPFSTTTERFRGDTSDSAPGPGAYEQEELLSASTAYMAFKPTSGFVSGSKRYDAAAASSAPPPGQYDVNLSWSKGPKARRDPGVGPMGLYSERFKGARSSDTPGPGAYDSHRIAAPSSASISPKRSAGAVLTAPRFSTRTPTTGPGPAHYSVDTPLLKKTYNITIAEEEHKASRSPRSRGLNFSSLGNASVKSTDQGVPLN